MRAAESCLQNPILIQKILELLSPDSMENLKLRLLNKSFDLGVLHLIRITHRNIRFEVPGALDFRLFGGEVPEEIGLILEKLFSLPIQ